jgi:hypothetical protein
MLDVNKERLSRITQLRAQGATITQIAAATGYPRSSVGHYVKKYIGGKTVAGKPQEDKLAHAQAQGDIVVESRPQVDRVESYMRQLVDKEGLSLGEVFEGKRKEEDLILEEAIFDMLQTDPETLNARLTVVERLIKLEPFLSIRMDNMRAMIGMLLTEPRGAVSSVSAGFQQQPRQNLEERGTAKLSEIFPDKSAQEVFKRVQDARVAATEKPA